MGKKENPHKLSELAGVDAGLFKGRKPSAELKAMREEWTEEFDNRISKFAIKSTRK